MTLKEKWRVVGIILMIFLVACIETDMYLPALPDMMRYFHTSEAMIQSLLSWNFIGICLSGPFYGPLSDAYGRKPCVMVALTLFVIGSVGTTLSQSIEMMLFWRVLQGLGCGGCFTIGTTVIFDRFHHEDATKIINDLNCVVPVMMALAPAAGAYLNLHYGFRSNFLAITLLSILSWFMVLLFLPESLAKENRRKLSLASILKDFSKAMKSFAFWAPTMTVAFIFAGYLAYVSYSAVLFVNDFGVSQSIYPLYQMSVLMAFVMASISCNRMIEKISVTKTKRYGYGLLLLGGLWFMVCAFLWPRHFNLFHIGMLLYSFAAGWLIGPLFTDSMEVLPEIKGVSASLVTSFRLLFTAIFIALINLFFDNSIYPLLIGFVGLSCCGLMVAMGQFKKNLA